MTAIERMAKWINTGPQPRRILIQESPTRDRPFYRVSPMEGWNINASAKKNKAREHPDLETAINITMDDLGVEK